MEFALQGLGLAWDFSLLPFLFLPFGMGMAIPILSQPCILEAHNLLGFTGSQVERNFSSGYIIALSLSHT